MRIDRDAVATYAYPAAEWGETIGLGAGSIDDGVHIEIGSLAEVGKLIDEGNVDCTVPVRVLNQLDGLGGVVEKLCGSPNLLNLSWGARIPTSEMSNRRPQWEDMAGLGLCQY